MKAPLKQGAFFYVLLNIKLKEMANTCTDLIVGISENECDCYTAALDAVTPAAPAWYQQSTSGLFLDELESEGLITMRATNGTLSCDKTLGTFYQEALAQAIKRTTDDAFTMISARLTEKKETFNGRIGGNKFDRDLIIPGAVIAGILLSPRPIIDGVFKLNSLTIGSSLNRLGFVISIYRNYLNIDQDPELIQNITDVTTVQNRSTTKVFADPIILPMEVDQEPVEYLFIYTMADGEGLKNTSTSCGCGRKEMIFNSYATFQGITIQAGALSMADYSRTTATSYGISLDGQFSCDSTAIICRMFDRSLAWKKVFAYAVRYLAGAIVNEKVINSPDLSRWNMVNFDDIRANALNFRGEYSSRITWLAQNVDPSVNDCYQCAGGGPVGMRKQGILS